MFLAFILLPLVSFNFYSTSFVIGQETQKNYSYKDILICQVMKYLDLPIGSNTQQVSNICSYHNSIGYNQSIAELCFIFSGKSIDIVGAFCEKALSDQMPFSPAPTTAAAVNETNDILDNQNNIIDDGSRLTIFDGVSKFFSNMFNS